MDLKSGLYAFLDIAGFYIDTNWIGNKIPGIPGPGLYWLVKNLVAKCGDCGEESCKSQAADKILDLIDHSDDKTYLQNDLKESTHVSKDSIYSLDHQMEGEEMPTGDPENICVAARPVPPGHSQGKSFDGKKKKHNPCQIKQKSEL